MDRVRPPPPARETCMCSASCTSSSKEAQLRPCFRSNPSSILLQRHGANGGQQARPCSRLGSTDPVPASPAAPPAVMARPRTGARDAAPILCPTLFTSPIQPSHLQSRSLNCKRSPAHALPGHPVSPNACSAQCEQQAKAGCAAWSRCCLWRRWWPAVPPRLSPPLTCSRVRLLRGCSQGR